jgi:hypothetical protein
MKYRNLIYFFITYERSIFELQVYHMIITFFFYYSKFLNDNSDFMKVWNDFPNLDWFDFWCFNAPYSNISAISWRPVLVVEEAGVPGENHRPRASNW